MIFYALKCVALTQGVLRCSLVCCMCCSFSAIYYALIGQVGYSLTYMWSYTYGLIPVMSRVSHHDYACTLSLSCSVIIMHDCARVRAPAVRSFERNKQQTAPHSHSRSPNAQTPAQRSRTRPRPPRAAASSAGRSILGAHFATTPTVIR